MTPTTPTTSSNKRCCFISAGLALIALGLIGTTFRTYIVEAIAPSYILKPGTMIDEYWRNPPVQVPTDIYIFNWTNAGDIYNLATKPKFEQLGPYKYLQTTGKTNVIYNENNTVTFNQVRTWYYDEKRPNGNLSDSVTSLNAVTMAGAYKVRFWDYWSKSWVSTIFSTMSPDISITRTVDQILFEGHHDAIMEMFQYLPFLAPEVPRFDRFGWFRMRNGSASFDGTFNMANGVDQNYDVLEWNYDDRTPYYEGSCGNVHGSAGELYSRKPSRDALAVFYTDVCRSLILDYEADVMVNGILGYKYSVGRRVLDNGTLIPDNLCYCTGDCVRMPSGVLNATLCKYGLPTFISLPNFYRADPAYVNSLEGLLPDRDKHEAYIVLEPNTGSLLKAVLRLQLNTLMLPVEHIGVYENVPQLVFPLLWVQQEMEIPPHAVPLLKLYLRAPLIISVLSYVAIVGGLGLILFAMYKLANTYVYEEVELKPSDVLKPEEVPL